jgi:general L-amino acid transport system permease protein
MKEFQKKILPQSIFLLVIILFFGFLTFNAQINMENRGMEFGFEFLERESSFDIQFSLIEYSRSSSYLRAYFVGLINTIVVAVTGIILATIIGVIIGISRLSQNFLIRKSAGFYVDLFRNLPLLLQIFFWYYAALRLLPLPQDSTGIYDSFYLTIKGLYTPALIWENLSTFIYVFIFSIIIIIALRFYAKKIQEEKGKQIPIIPISISILIIFPLLTFIFGDVGVNIIYPELKELSATSAMFEGGLEIPPEFLALILALSIYTATFIAECVRAGILGINKGQKEAAASIGLNQKQILKLIIMPQALRIIIPPTTNQYLNLTKNSSLAAAIAYPDVVLVFAGTALMQTGKAIEIITMIMFTYLTLSITISIFMNWYNKKIAIKEK